MQESILINYLKIKLVFNKLDFVVTLSFYDFINYYFAVKYIRNLFYNYSYSLNVYIHL